jgi:hypothetical protein
VTNQLEERRANRLAVKPVQAEARLLYQSCFQRKHQEKDIMVILAQIVLPPAERERFGIASVLLGIRGTRFLTYGQLQRCAKRLSLNLSLLKS